MKQTVRELQGEAIVARDGAIGAVADVFFDDHKWAVRYFVVDTGRWLTGRRVLVSPAAIDAETSTDDEVHVRLTREQVQSAPDVDTDRPVSRQQEIAHAAHFGYPYYWNGPLLWGAAAQPTRPEPGIAPSAADAERAAQAEAARGDSHLRSAAEVIGYALEARDGELGKVADFVVDEATWAISEIVLDTTPWLPGGKVRVPAAQIEGIDLNARKVHLHMSREELQRLASSSAA